MHFAGQNMTKQNICQNFEKAEGYKNDIRLCSTCVHIIDCYVCVYNVFVCLYMYF